MGKAKPKGRKPVNPGDSFHVVCTVDAVYQQRFEPSRLRARAAPPRLYAIARRRRLVCRKAKVTRRQAIVASFEFADTGERFPSAFAIPDPPEPLDIRINARGDFFELFSMADGQTRAVGDCNILALMGQPELAGLLEVLYVGQTRPGTARGRTVYDRLDNHPTLQRIYSDHQAELYDVVIALIELSESAFTNTGPDGWGDPDADDGPSFVTWATTASEIQREKVAVSLAEGALIAFFDPPYNRALKDTFPGQKQGPVREMREYGVGHLFVALDCGPYSFHSASQTVANPFFLAYAALSDERGVIDGLVEWSMERAWREQNLFLAGYHVQARRNRDPRQFFTLV